MKTVCVIALLLLGGCDWVFGLDHVSAPPDDAHGDAAPIESGWKVVAAGYAHTCAIRADDTLWCWGNNEQGELGAGVTTLQIDQPVQIGSARWLSVATSDEATCGIQTDHSLWCWGENGFGQLGTGDTTASYGPLHIANGFKVVSPAPHHTCGIRDDATLWCWGQNAFGQLGDGTMMPQPSPLQIGTAMWLEVSTGTTTSCGIQTDHTLWCWGDNTYGQYGDGGMPSAVPRQVGSDKWLHIRAGENVDCGITMSGHMQCSGTGARGELGDGVSTYSYVFVPVTAGGVDADDWVRIDLRYQHTCGTRGDGSLWCWGDDARAQLGAEVALTHSATPLQVSPGKTWTSVVTGEAHSCAIDGDNELWCFGADSRAQLGDGGSDYTVPTKIPGTWTAVNAGVYGTCALDASTGNPACAGYNTLGQLGDNTKIDRQLLTPVMTSVTGWTMLAVGQSSTCGLVGANIYCWGYNGNGAFGTNNLASSATPVIANGTGYSAVVSVDQTCALAGAGMYCWGYNAYGQVGNGTATANVVAPFNSIAASSNVYSVTAGLYHSCGLLTSGTAMCFGRGNEGEIGNGTNNSSLTPTPVMQSTSGAFISLSAGAFHTCARAVNKSLWCWGYNIAGSLGTGDATARLVPTLISTATWKQIAPGAYHTCGLQENGTLWCWGGNQYGQLGIGSHASHFLPVQVGTDSDWTTVVAGHHHTCAAKPDNSLWCWGWNDYGQLGDGLSWRPPVHISVP